MPFTTPTKHNHKVYGPKLGGLNGLIWVSLLEIKGPFEESVGFTLGSGHLIFQRVGEHFVGNVKNLHSHLMTVKNGNFLMAHCPCLSQTAIHRVVVVGKIYLIQWLHCDRKQWAILRVNIANITHGPCPSQTIPITDSPKFCEAAIYMVGGRALGDNNYLMGMFSSIVKK